MTIVKVSCCGLWACNWSFISLINLVFLVLRESLLMGETVEGLFEQLQKQLKVKGEEFVESFKVGLFYSMPVRICPWYWLLAG